jgi:hypothetical protein
VFVCVCVWCAVELFVRTGLMMETQRRFRYYINRQEAPSPKATRRWIRQWREEGSVVCKKANWSAVLSLYTRQQCPSFDIHRPQSEAI